MAGQKKNTLFVKLFDSKTLTLTFNSPTISGKTLIESIQSLINVPPRHHHHFLYLSEGRHVSPETLISSNDHRLFPTVNVLIRLLGGKGGFGSLLRGAATKAGQKKTNNFDACRDMSGRRLRHVNAEKKLEEWRLDLEERKLEKVAEDFLKKNAKTVKGTVSGDSTNKYVEKYREQSALCVAEVEVAVREAMGGGVGGGRNGKRKGVTGKNKLDSKRLKNWSGKKKMEGSDSDEDGSSSDDDDGVNEKSIVLDDGNPLDLSKEADGSTSSVSGGKLNGESSSGGLCESGCEEEKEMVVLCNSESTGSPGSSVDRGEDAVSVSGAEAVDTEKQDTEPKLGSSDDVEGQPQQSSSSEEKGEYDCASVHPVDIGSSENESGVIEEKGSACANLKVEKPLNFDEYSSAAEMEILGMDRLKSELQAFGLKCGGTLQERAARLFMLKTTPLEKLPKKLLAKK